MPRTRGGLPLISLEEARAGLFAPHTRGSTLDFILLIPSRVVCPAHAGVYPPTRRSPPPYPSLPRTRGGLPHDYPGAGAIISFAPHTRGSTRRLDVHPHPIRVCPAHAGVYPMITREPEPSSRLPRTRGGLPIEDSGETVRLRFAPHTRGSTYVSWYGPRSYDVCPAHAGVYPCLHPWRYWSLCLPRTRGGLPHDYPGAGAIISFAPHTRGSTSGCTSMLKGRWVCPAHAGVYPSP